MTPQRLLPWFWCAAVLLGLPACTTLGPDFTTPQAALQARWSPGSPAEAPTPDGFWQGFDDPALMQLLEHAVASSPSLRTSALQVEQARAQLGITQGTGGPRLDLAGGATYSEPDLPSSLQGTNGGSTTRQVLGQLAWEIDFWGRQRRTVEADQASLAATEMALAAARVSLEASVASTYCSIRVLEQRIAVAEDNLLQQAENMRIAEARFRLGATSERDWRQAQSQYEQTRSQVPGLRISLAQNQHALSVLVGQTPDYYAREFGSGVRTGLPAAPQALPLGAPRDLLRRRPDVRQTELSAAAQSARIGQAEAALYPTFSLSGSFGFSTTGSTRDLFTWDSRMLSSGLGFSFPLFDRGRLVSQVLVQDSLFAQAVLAYQSQVLKAQQEVEDALAQIAGGNAQLDSLRQGDEAAVRSATLALAQYRSGQTDYTTVSSAEQSRLQSSDAVVQAQGSLLQAYVTAYRALGGGWSEIATENPGSAAP